MSEPFGRLRRRDVRARLTALEAESGKRFGDGDIQPAPGSDSGEEIRNALLACPRILRRHESGIHAGQRD